MKSKIPSLIVIALAAMVLAGCQKPPENPPGAPPNTNSTGSTNLSQAKAPAVPDSSATNNPVSTNR